MRNKKLALIITLALLIQCLVVTGLVGAVPAPAISYIGLSIGGRTVDATPAAYQATFDLAAYADSDVLSSITVGKAADVCDKLVITKASSAQSSVTYTREFTGFADGVLVIPAADFMPGDVTLGTLRAVFGGTVTIEGSIHLGDASQAVWLTLNLGNAPEPFNWGTLSNLVNNTLTATIKSSVLSTPILGSLGLEQIVDLVEEKVGSIPKLIATTAGAYYPLSRDLSVLKSTFKALFDPLSWETATFDDLITQGSVYFKLSETGAVHTIKFVKESGGGPGPVIPVDPGGGGGGGGTVEPPLVTEPKEDEAGQTVHEVRATAGLIPDIVTAKFHGKTSLTLDITAQLPEAEEVAVLAVQIPKEIVKSLAGLDLVLNTPYSDLVLPKALIEALAAEGEGLDLTMQPGDPEAVQAQIEEYHELLADPVEIITSIAGSTTVTLPCSLVLPEDEAEREAFLANLYVLAIHGEDDLEQLVELEFNIDEETSTLLSVSFQVERFSTFAIVAAGEEPEEPEQPVKLYTVIDSKVYTVDEAAKAFDNLTAYRANDTTTVMAVRLLQELGAQIGYKRVDNVGVVTVIHDDITVTLREKSKTMTIVDAAGERQVTLRAVFTNLNGRTYLPTRDVAENLGFFVHWAAADDSITITAK